MKKIKSGFVFKSVYGQKYTGDIYSLKYYNGNTRLELINEDGVMAIITSNLALKLGKDEIFVKNYSENEGMMEQLVEQGVVEDLEKYLETDHVKLHLCKILVPFKI